MKDIVRYNVHIHSINQRKTYKYNRIGKSKIQEETNQDWA